MTNDKISRALTNAINAVKKGAEDAAKGVAEAACDEEAIKNVMVTLARASADSADSVGKALLLIRDERWRAEFALEEKNEAPTNEPLAL